MPHGDPLLHCPKHSLANDYRQMSNNFRQLCMVKKINAADTVLQVVSNYLHEAMGKLHATMLETDCNCADGESLFEDHDHLEHLEHFFHQGNDVSLVSNALPGQNLIACSKQVLMLAFFKFSCVLHCTCIDEIHYPLIRNTCSSLPAVILV